MVWVIVDDIQTEVSYVSIVFYPEILILRSKASHIKKGVKSISLFVDKNASINWPYLNGTNSAVKRTANSKKIHLWDEAVGEDIATVDLDLGRLNASENHTPE